MQESASTPGNGVTNTNAALGIVTTAATTASIASNFLSTIRNTNSGIRFENWLFYSDIALTNPTEVKTFKKIFEALRPFCKPEVGSELPAPVTECWKLLEYEDINSTVYKFPNPLDLRETLKNYASANVAAGTVYNGCSLTESIISDLAAVSLAKVDATQNIARILFIYISCVALNMSLLKEQRQLIARHLRRITNLLINQVEYRNYFQAKALSGLQKVHTSLTEYINAPYLHETAAQINQALKECVQHQVQLVSQLNRVLIICTEGGNKARLITIDKKKIAQGKLSDKEKESHVTFHPENPLKDFCMSVASFAQALDEKFYRKLERPLPPTESGLKTYFKNSLERGIYLNGGRSLYGDDAVLYMLEQTLQNKKAVWGDIDPENTTTNAAKMIHRLACRTRTHLALTDIVVALEFILRVKGLEWLDTPKVTHFMQNFLWGYERTLSALENELTELHHYLQVRVKEGGFGPEHDILVLLENIKSGTLSLLRKQGLTPLSEFQKNLHGLMPIVPPVIRRLCKYVNVLLIEDPAFEALNNHELSSIFGRKDQERENPLLAALLKTQTFDECETNIMIEEGIVHNNSLRTNHGSTIQTLFQHLHEYVERKKIEGKGYQFCLEDDEPAKGGTEEHNIRATWIKHLMQLLNQPGNERDILEKAKDRIDRLKADPELYAHFTYRFSTPTIQTLIDSISTDIKLRLEKIYDHIPEEKLTMPAGNPIDANEPFDSPSATATSGAAAAASSGAAAAASSGAASSAEDPNVTLIKKLVASIEFFSKSQEKDKREGFLTFLKKLCWIDTPWFWGSDYISEKMIGYHREIIMPQKTAIAEMARWNEVRQLLPSDSASEALRSWATYEAADILRISNPAEKAKVTASQAQEGTHARLVALESKKNDMTTQMQVYQRTGLKLQNVEGLAWSDSELNFLLKYQNDRPLLTLISQRLLQPHESRPNIDAVLNACLHQAFLKHSSWHDDKDKKQPKKEDELHYWETVIKALIVLGANPIQWIEEQKSPEARKLLIQQADLIFAHITYRGRFLGEVASRLHVKLQEFKNALHEFASTLFECEESVWRKIYEIIADPSGARDERANLLWSIVGWVHCLLNEQTTGPAPDGTVSVYQKAWNRYEAAKSALEKIERNDYWIQHNAPAFKKLSKTVETLSEIAAQILKSRKDRAEKERIDREMQQKNAELKRAQSLAEDSKKQAVVADKRTQAAEDKLHQVTKLLLKHCLSVLNAKLESTFKPNPKWNVKSVSETLRTIVSELAIDYSAAISEEKLLSEAHKHLADPKYAHLKLNLSSGVLVSGAASNLVTHSVFQPAHTVVNVPSSQTRPSA